jgi:hypothetical protein
MKKSTPHFTFEVKRSRLPSQKASTFQRFIIEPKPAEPPPKQELLDRVGNSDAVVNVALPERRVLPSIVENFAREEPVVVRPKKRRVRRKTRVAEPESVMAGAANEINEPNPVEEDLTIRPATVLPFVKRQRAIPKTVADLPRSQKWKRRLPRVAW